MRAPPWSMLCVGALLAVAASAQAEEPRNDGAASGVEIHWTAPPECPSEAVVRAALLALLGGAFPATGAPPIPVRLGAAYAERGPWTVRIEIEQPGSAAPRQRRIAGDTCAEVADAAAVATALALAPALADDAPSPSQPPSTPPASALLPSSDERGERAAPSPSTRLRPGLRLLGGADFATMPSPSPGAQLAALLQFGANRIELSLAGWLPERAQASAKPSAGGAVSLLAVGARYCRSLLLADLELAGCAGLEGGAMLGDGFGVTAPRLSASPWLAPGLGLLGSYALSRTFALTLGVEGLAPIIRGTFTLDGLGEVYRPPPITGRALAGVELRFR